MKYIRVCWAHLFPALKTFYFYVVVTDKWHGIGAPDFLKAKRFSVQHPLQNFIFLLFLLHEQSVFYLLGHPRKLPVHNMGSYLLRKKSAGLLLLFKSLKEINNQPTGYLSAIAQWKLELGTEQFGVTSHQLLVSTEMEVGENFSRTSTESLYFFFIV